MKTTMKQIATAFFFGVCLLGTLLPVRSQETQVERRHTKKKAEIPDQLQVKPGTRIANPEFIRRLADPELNLEFARRYPDPTQRLQAAQALADQFCTDLNISISLGSDAQGCYMDVTYMHTYTYGPGTNAFWLPHGIYVDMCPGVQITSAQVLSGAWFTGATFGSNPSVSPWNAVWWVKQPSNPSDYSNIIPSGQTLTVRLRVPAFCAGTSCVVTVRELTGWAYPNYVNFWSCQQQNTIIIQSIAYSIGPDTSVCTGSATTICITPTPPPGAQVTWYKYTGTPCPPANCLTSPPWQAGSPWQQAQVGGNCYNTNILTQTTCYVAVVTSGCATVVTNVKKIEVCPGPPSATIVATPASGFPSPTVINGVDHACTNWQGQLCLNPSTFPCPTTIVNWTVNGLPVPNSAGQTCINTGLLTLKPATACSTTYVFRATLKNACGTTTPTWKIVIDRPPDPGSISANPPPPLCYDRSTMLKHTTSCGKVVEWEKREELSPCTGNYGPWTVIPGSQGTSVWWTNDLQKTTQYRVKVENGACPPVYSPVYTVTVKPKLEVTISANKTYLCPPDPVILTATYTWGPPCNYSVTYQWYQDGVPIPGATGPTYSPTAGGNYYVVVDGGPCGKAKSNVITICDRPRLEIIGECCVCPGETIELCAKVLWTPQNCQPPSCTYQWNTGATTQCIQVSTPGDYTVIVNCDGCKLTRTFNVGSCSTSGNNTDLTIGKRAPALPWQVNQPAQFDISVNNQGPGSVPAGTPITVTDYIPAGMDYTGSSGTGWSCTPPSGTGPVTVTCTYTGGLAPEQAAPILTLNVTPTQPGKFENCAEVKSPLPDPNPGNNKGCVGVEVKPPCVKPPSGMVAWWPFDEGAGSVAGDIAGTPNNGTLVNGPTWIPGMVGGALRFDGQNDYVQVPNHPELNVGTGNFTLDAWVRTTASLGVVVLVDKRTGTGFATTAQGYALFLSNGRLGFQMANGVGSGTCAPTPTPGVSCVNYGSPTSTLVADGQWHHVAAVVDRADATSGVRLYVDGNLVFTGAPLSGDLNNTSDLYIGVRTPGQGGGGFFPGDLDELELFKRALSQDEIQKIYNAGPAGKCK